MIHSLLTAEIEGDRLSEEEVVANCIITMIGGQETTTNLIASGLLTLLRNPLELQRLRNDPALLPSAVEELLRYESPSQHTARIAPADFMLGGKHIRKGQALMAVMAAGNRDPNALPTRTDSTSAERIIGIWRLAGQRTFVLELRLRAWRDRSRWSVQVELPNLQLASNCHTWRSNSGLRGLAGLPVTFDAKGNSRRDDL